MFSMHVAPQFHLFIFLLKEKYEKDFQHDEKVSQQNGMTSLRHTRPAPEAAKPTSSLHRTVHGRSRPPSQPTIIRGVTYYKAKDVELENDLDERELLSEAFQNWGGEKSWTS